MDTHITDRAEIQVEEAEETLSHPLPSAGTDRLGGFRSIDQGERLTQETPPPVRKRRRNGLMVTACSVAVLAVAGGVFWISPYNHYSFADASRIATHARDAALNEMPSMSAPAPVAPAARLARAPEPTHPTALYRAPPPVSIASQHGDDMAEFLKLGGQGGPTSVPEPNREVASAPAATPRIPVAQAAPAAPAVEATPQAQESGASAAAPGPLKQTDEAARSSAPAPIGPQPDAVVAIAALRPAPMTEPQQVQVLDLVAQLGTLVRDQRAEIAQLRQDQEHVGQHVTSPWRTSVVASRWQRRVAL